MGEAREFSFSILALYLLPVVCSVTPLFLNKIIQSHFSPEGKGNMKLHLNFFFQKEYLNKTD